jgi:hypothetical protein
MKLPATAEPPSLLKQSLLKQRYPSYNKRLGFQTSSSTRALSAQRCSPPSALPKLTQLVEQLPTAHPMPTPQMSMQQPPAVELTCELRIRCALQPQLLAQASSLPIPIHPPQYYWLCQPPITPSNPLAMLPTCHNAPSPTGVTTCQTAPP